MNVVEKLREIKAGTGMAETLGLPDDLLLNLSQQFPQLEVAVQSALDRFRSLSKEERGLLKLPEMECVHQIQADIVNFYPETQVNPYIALAAKGPWLVTCHGAVLHDSGGYGMLGQGHGPEDIIAAMSGDHVIANVMTANLSQKRLTDKLNKEIGHTHQLKGKLFHKYVFMNSGSEAVTVAMRISDLNAKNMTDKGGHHEGQSIRLLAHSGGFHGRTDRPAQASDSSLPNYQVLASFRDRKNLLTVEPNNITQLTKIFAEANKSNIFIELLLLEPVMGEGNPGVAITPEYYKAARSLTKQHGSLLLIDSIQAGLRAFGCLSVMDYPGFADLEPPDFETFSKALNAGQFPLSVLAMTDSAASLYRKGIYGNTMTANPRALEVASRVLENLTPELRQNIQARGNELIEKFHLLQKRFPTVVTKVTGTGLLSALHLVEEGYKVVGEKGLELYLRQHGIGVIHGGKNALRFTPHFNMTSEEINLIYDQICAALERGPVYS